MTLTCADAISVVDVYVDGELQSELAACLQRHLAACQDCSRRIAFRRRVDRLVRRCLSSQGATEPPEALARAIRRALMAVESSPS